jgi:porin
VELKVGYQANVVEYWGPFLAGNLASSIFGPSGSIPVEAGLSAWAWTKPAINIKVNGPKSLTGNAASKTRPLRPSFRGDAKHRTRNDAQYHGLHFQSDSNGLYDKFGVQVASNPDGPLAEKSANPTGLDWSTPNSGVLVINEFGYRTEAAPGQFATWVRAASIVNTSRYVDFRIWRAEYSDATAPVRIGKPGDDSGPSAIHDFRRICRTRRHCVISDIS